MFGKKKKLSLTQVIALGFFIIITVGTVLLLLPFAAKEGETSFVNALFTATSATCVTGLVTYDTYAHWTLFGQLVILVMIQIGGLGFITIGVFAMHLLRKKIGLRKRELIHESVNSLHVGGSVRLVKKIIFGTLFFESIGAVGLAICFYPDMGLVKSIYYGIFHSVSAFCNAGFDLMGYQEAYCSFINYYDHIGVNLIIMSLVIIGGIGFLVWDDLSKNKFHVKSYLLHTKIVLSCTGILLIGGAVLFWIMEKDTLLQGMSVRGQILASMFSAVTPRTAGFNTIDTAALTGGAKFLTILLMFIGGSPGSTAGGIKTTTIVVIIVFVLCTIKNKKSMNLFNRRFAEDAIRKASTVFFINLLLTVTAVLLICAHQELPLTDVIFEAFSAIGTVGMSTGVTRELSVLSKAAIIFLMYCGRVGSLSFAIAFRDRKPVPPVLKPVEKITIG